jgi:indole-3-glycerol phosphate synthase
MKSMVDYIADLARKAEARVRRGYYDNVQSGKRSSESLVETIQKSSITPVITEVKFASPSAGKIRDQGDPLRIAEAMLRGGACAISVLTDPEDFHGNLETLATLSRRVDAPLVMKDIVVSPLQIEAATRAGARAVVLISEVFSRRLVEQPLDELVGKAHRLGLDVLLEANSLDEFRKLADHEPDLYGINNRNLSTFNLDLSTTERVLAANGHADRPIVSESGIEHPEDILRLKKAGADAFLVGTSIMKSTDVESKVRELVNA